MKLLPGPGAGFGFSPGGNPNQADTLAGFTMGRIAKTASQYGDLMATIDEFAAHMSAGITGAAPYGRIFAVDD
jgi:hypothetical protein